MSTNIYPRQKSYTYLIKFIPTGQVYYGVRYGNKIPPEEDLWKKYFTSSKVVKQLLEEHGPESFEFEVRKTFDDPEKARIWEENVLKRMNVVHNDQWLNKTDSRNFDLSGARQTFLEKYGVDNPFKSEIVQEKVKKTLQKKYGCDSPLQSEIFREKMKKTNKERYGCENPLQCENFREKYKQTNLERYGVENPAKSEEVKAKMKKTNKERYGCENPAKAEEVRAKISQTLKKRYQCCECDYVSNRSAVTKHQNKTGHTGAVSQDETS